MATSKVHTSLMKNPPRKTQTNRAKSAANRAKRRTTATKRTAAKSRAVRSRRSRRNGYISNGVGGIVGAVIAALAGALVITGFDYGMNRIAPNSSAPIRIGAKVLGGLAIGYFGASNRYLGKWANIAQGALLIAGGLDFAGNYVMPLLLNWMQPSQPTVTQIQNPATGQMGYRVRTNDGGVFDLMPPGQQSLARRPAYA